MHGIQQSKIILLTRRTSLAFLGTFAPDYKITMILIMDCVFLEIMTSFRRKNNTSQLVVAAHKKDYLVVLLRGFGKSRIYQLLSISLSDIIFFLENYNCINFYQEEMGKTNYQTANQKLVLICIFPGAHARFLS